LENFELNIEAPPKRYRNYFPKGNIPFNKGVPMKEWMDGRKIKKVKKYLVLGRKLGNHSLAGHNRKEVVGIKDGKLIAFKSMVEAQKALRSKGVKISARNISTVCREKPQLFQKKYNYIRKKAGGYRWFFADDTERYKIFLSDNLQETK
jgi:hypothetical protein